MRVVAVSPVTHLGGAEVLLVDVLTGLVERGHRALLVTCGGPGELAQLAECNGLETAPAPGVRLRRPSSFLRAGSAVRAASKAFAADHLHLNHPHAGLVGALARLGDVSMSIQLHDPAPPYDVSAAAMSAVRAHFIANSQFTADAYLRRLPRAVSLTVIRPGRDLERFRAAALVGDADRVLAAAGVDNISRPLVVMIGRLQAFKGIFRFIDASSRVPHSAFVHIGPDAPTEPGVRARARAMIEERCLSRRVGLAGPVSLADLAATVARADLLLHLAEGEAFGLALVEAMAVGTPPVAMDAPGPLQILANGGGVLLLDGDAATVAAAIRPLLDDRHRLAALGAEARTCSETFSTRAMIDAYGDLFTRAHDSLATTPRQ